MAGLLAAQGRTPTFRRQVRVAIVPSALTIKRFVEQHALANHLSRPTLLSAVRHCIYRTVSECNHRACSWVLLLVSMWPTEFLLRVIQPSGQEAAAEVDFIGIWVVCFVAIGTGWLATVVLWKRFSVERTN